VCIQWSPLCRGHLARPVSEYGNNVRSSLEKEHNTHTIGRTEADLAIINRVEEIAKKRGWSMTQVSLAWINKRVASPIIGFSSEERMDAALAARGCVLTEEEERYLEEPYRPRPVNGHQ
jgi:aryl-alcohol dehydrogenase-like predicted oxidoreductase